jgi:hypothetical protein
VGEGMKKVCRRELPTEFLNRKSQMLTDFPGNFTNNLLYQVQTNQLLKAALASKVTKFLMRSDSKTTEELVIPKLEGL